MADAGTQAKISVVAALWLALGLSACGNLGDTAYLRQPSPVPTLARLATTTPAQPTATAAPTAVAAAPSATPQPSATPIVGVLIVTANIRSGPGVDYEVVGYRDQGSEVWLLAESEGWYNVELSDGLRGWVAGQLLTIDEAAAAAVPTATVTP